MTRQKRMDTFFNNLKLALHEKRISNSAFVKKVGVTEQALYYWYNGHTNIRFENVLTILEVLKLDFDYFFCENEEKALKILRKNK